MKEHGFLFSDPMLLAVLDGLKTQTRRLLTDHNTQGNYRASELLLDQAWVDPGPSAAGNPGPYLKAPINCEEICRRNGWKPGDADPQVVERLYPRVFAGDRIWVRGWWYCPKQVGGTYQREKLLHRATFDGINPPRWRPSFLQPKWATPQWLEVTEVRIQRLQEINETDAEAEGLTKRGYWWDVGLDWEGDGIATTATETFALLWDSINGKWSPWAANEWVLAYTFRRVDR